MTRDDAVRELQKISDALNAADRHFTAEAQMNAALHMSDVVRPAPLAAAIGTALLTTERLIETLRAEGIKQEEGPWPQN